MKLAIIALVLAVSLIQSTDAWWGGYGWGGYGGYGWGGYGGYYGGYGGWGYWGKRDATLTETKVPVKVREELMNRTECVLIKETSLLSCHGPSGIKECPVVLKWDKPVTFELFGLALPVEITEVLSEMKYRIFPRKLDNTAWTVYSDKVDRDVSLYHSEKYNDYGLMVQDKLCFEGLVSVLKSSIRKELVVLGTQTVTMIGDLMLSHKSPKALLEKDEIVKRLEATLAELEEKKMVQTRELEKQIIKHEVKIDLLNEQLTTVKRELTLVEKDMEIMPTTTF